jgi:hypothetical protein
MEGAHLAALDAIRTRLQAYWPSDDVDQLNQLVGDLSIAIDRLIGTVASDRIAVLRTAWWYLEYINAAVLASDRGVLTPEEVRATSSAREDFLALLSSFE